MKPEHYYTYLVSYPSLYKCQLIFSSSASSDVE